MHVELFILQIFVICISLSLTGGERANILKKIKIIRPKRTLVSIEIMRKENFFEKFSSKSLKFSYFRGLTMRTLLAEKEKIKKISQRGLNIAFFVAI